MPSFKHFLLLLFLAVLFGSCKDDLEVNADWKDITVVYGILDQNDTIHYLKITKAFLGPGDALSFARIQDSSNYKQKLDVRIEGWEITSKYDSSLKQTILFDTVTITNKQPGDTVFYYPDQLVYKSVGNSPLNSNYVYKLFIYETNTGKEITAQTSLVQKIGTIQKPQPAPAKASFITGMKSQAVWTSAEGGKRYQYVARFYYLETKISDSSQTTKYVDWVIFNDLRTETTEGGVEMQYSYPNDVFYVVLGNKIPVDNTVRRTAYKMEYIFTVAADDLNTYMEVTEPSYTIVQEKPPFTNITNGIGLFSSRHDNTKEHPIVQTTFSEQTLNELKVNPNTYLLGF
jgi:hypothetical protein